MKNLPLSNRPGQFAIVDDEDYPLLSRYTWSASVGGYAQAGIACYTLSLHRLILGPAPDPTKQIDHKNGNKLDNRKENLRWCTRLENLRWSIERRGRAGCFRGSIDHRKTKKGLDRYSPYFYVNNEQVWLGTFETKEAAAEALANALIKIGRMPPK